MTEFTNSFSKENWDSKYRYNNETTIDDTFRRVAKDLASIEKDPNKWENRFYSIMENFQFIPGGRILSNAGTNRSGTTYINCFVDGFKGIDQDSIEGIYSALTRQAQILKSEGGYGFCCSIMRPNGSNISGIGNQSPGSIRFLELWDKSSEIITMGSNQKPRPGEKKFIRKGAQMVTIHCWHPDVEEFITAKQTPGRLSKFNMSVLCTDKFMHAVKNNKPWNLIFPKHKEFKNQYKQWDGNVDKWISENGEDSVVIYKKYNSAKELWDLIMTNTYNRNEPGVLFIDTINKMNNLYYEEYIDATNPCGEQVLPKDGVCLLGSINLTQFIKDNNWDYDKLKKVIPVAIRLMDNVNDKTKVPLKTQKENLLNKRRIGLGVVGYGSALIIMGVRYGSKNAISKTEELMDFIMNCAYSSSALLAKEKVSFKLYKKQDYMSGEFIKRLNNDTINLIKKHGIRNSHLLSIQPTGNTSVLANIISSGLEPLFSFGYYRTAIQSHPPKGLGLPKKIDWDTQSFESSDDWKWIKEGDENLLRINLHDEIYKFDRNRGLTKENLVEDYSVSLLKQRGVWDETKDWACNIFNLEVDDHIKTMSVFAKYVDSAISKTINLSNNYEYEDFKDIYMKAWQANIKGFTTYREGTMTNVLSQNSSEEEIVTTKAAKRPKDLSCDVFNISVQTIPYFVLVGKLKDRPYEVFAGRAIEELKHCSVGRISKSKRPKGYRAILDQDVELFPLHAMSSDNEEALTRMISASLRHGTEIQFVVEQLEKVKGDMTTFAKAIARALKKYIPNGVKTKGECPECGEQKLVRLDGCKSCTNCSYTLCS